MAPDLIDMNQVVDRIYVLSHDDPPPDDELARMAGITIADLYAPTIERKTAVKLLGEIVVDAGSPELAEHIQAMRGIRDARLHGYTLDLKTMRKYRRDLVKHHGTVQLERALA